MVSVLGIYAPFILERGDNLSVIRHLRRDWLTGETLASVMKLEESHETTRHATSPTTYKQTNKQANLAQWVHSNRTTSSV